MEYGSLWAHSRVQDCQLFCPHRSKRWNNKKTFLSWDWNRNLRLWISDRSLLRLTLSYILKEQFKEQESVFNNNLFVSFIKCAGANNGQYVDCQSDWRLRNGRGWREEGGKKELWNEKSWTKWLFYNNVKFVCSSHVHRPRDQQHSFKRRVT